MTNVTAPLPDTLAIHQDEREAEKVEFERPKAAMEVYNARLAHRQARRAEYLAERSTLFHQRREVLKGYEQAQLALSVGALGLSITFVQQFAREQPLNTIWLFTAWLFLPVHYLTSCWAISSVRVVFVWLKAQLIKQAATLGVAFETAYSNLDGRRTVPDHCGQMVETELAISGDDWAPSWPDSGASWRSAQSPWLRQIHAEQNGEARVATG